MTLDIGSRRELFVDHYLIDRLDGAGLRLHEPRREGVAIRFDYPWEGPLSGYFTVLHDGERYRAYYRGWPELKDEYEGSVTCYAESGDGVTWEKPELGLYEVLGTRANNVILDEAILSVNFCPFLDTRPGVPSSERFKALAGTGNAAGSFGFVSEDGIHWRRLQEAHVIPKTIKGWDTQNVAFWSEHEQCYVAYIRSWKMIGDVDYRWIARTTSEDFIHWSDLVEMDYGDTPPEQLYTPATQPYFRAPHIYIALPKRYLPDTPALPPDEARALVCHETQCISSSDAVLMTSRGGNRYDRTFMEAFIRPGPSRRDWVARDNMPAHGVVPAGNDPRRMFIYRGSYSGQVSAHLTRYSLRLDGFASVNAPYRGAEMVTKPFRFEGNRLTLNFETSAAGGIRVEIQDAQGHPVPGHTLEDCPEFIGDQIDHTVCWTGGADVSSLAGGIVRLRFVMRDADLFALRFA